MSWPAPIHTPPTSAARNGQYRRIASRKCPPWKICQMLEIITGTTNSATASAGVITSTMIGSPTAGSPAPSTPLTNAPATKPATMTRSVTVGKSKIAGMAVEYLEQQVARHRTLFFAPRQAAPWKVIGACPEGPRVPTRQARVGGFSVPDNR